MDRNIKSKTLICPAKKYRHEHEMPGTRYR
jgi:hypothetical protein